MDRRADRRAARREARNIVNRIVNAEDQPEPNPDQPVLNQEDQEPMDIPSDSDSTSSSASSASDPQEHQQSASESGNSSGTSESDSDNDNNANSDSDDDRELRDEDLRLSLKAWACHYVSVPHTAIDGLLRILKPYHPLLPLSAKTLMNTPRGRTAVDLLDNGQFAYVGIKAGLEARLKKGLKEGSRNVKVDVNIDGVRVYENSTESAWNIAGRSLDLVDSRPFLIGMFYGDGKPTPMHGFLQDFIAETVALQEDGLPLNEDVIEVKLGKFVGDAQSRSYLKCCKGHPSCNGCEKCEQEGEHNGRLTVYSTRSANLRTDESFHARSDPDHHHEEVSPLESDLHVGMVSQFVLDVMHLRDLGVMKRFLEYITKTGPLRSRLDGQNIAGMSDELVSLIVYIPCEFRRKIRSIKHLPKWKAVQFRLFLLYLGVVVLYERARDEVYKLFLLFHCASVIMSNDCLLSEDHYIENAKVCLQNFVEYCARVLGAEFVVYNVHSLLHLADEVRDNGNADQYLSSYPFENYHREVKKLVRSHNKPLQQVVRRLKEMESCEKDVAVPEQGLLMRQRGGPLAGLPVIGEYGKFAADGVTYCLSDGDNATSFDDGKIGVIQNIVQCQDDSIKLIVKLFQSYDLCYDYPMPSSNLGIFLVSRLEDSLTVYDIANVKAKCMLLPFRGEFAAFPLLHLCKCKQAIKS